MPVHQCLVELIIVRDNTNFIITFINFVHDTLILNAILCNRHCFSESFVHEHIQLKDV